MYLFTQIDKPLWMDKYDFSGYSEGFLGIGAGNPQFINKETGETVKNPHIAEGLDMLGTEFQEYIDYRRQLLDDYDRVSDIQSHKAEIDWINRRIASVKKSYPEKSGYRNHRLPELLARKQDILDLIESLER